MSPPNASEVQRALGSESLATGTYSDHFDPPITLRVDGHLLGTAQGREPTSSHVLQLETEITHSDANLLRQHRRIAWQLWDSAALALSFAIRHKGWQFSRIRYRLCIETEGGGRQEEFDPYASDEEDPWGYGFGGADSGGVPPVDADLEEEDPGGDRDSEGASGSGDEAFPARGVRAYGPYGAVQSYAPFRSGGGGPRF